MCKKSDESNPPAFSSTKVMQNQSVWKHLDVALPKLNYKEGELQLQGKGSTEWAAHSHAPISVGKWNDFDQAIRTESLKPSNNVNIKANVSGDMQSQRLRKVIEEEHVTHNTVTLLDAAFSGLEVDFEFSTTPKYTVSNPDITFYREKVQSKIIYDTNEYSSPNNRARKREYVSDNVVVSFTMETKPFWKFNFLCNAEDSTELLISNWRDPSDYNAEKILREEIIPKEWTHVQKKVFHLIRQAYGQMVSSQLRYGIIHLYEIWWFCRRDESGHLQISRPFKRDDTSPSVLQAIKTLAGFDDFGLLETTVHPVSCIKGKIAKPNSDESSADKKDSQERNNKKRSGGGGSSVGSSNTKSRLTTTLRSDPDGFASGIFMWDCKILDFNENVKLLSNRKYPSVLIKIPHKPEAKHVIEEIENEAAIYCKLSENPNVNNAIAKFYGFSTHLGIPLLCISKEGPDFEDIGVENLSRELKESAVDSLCILSEAGLLHNDLDLRNIVQSKDNPKQAKIVDFGRAVFTEDQQLLKRQVEALKSELEF